MSDGSADLVAQIQALAAERERIVYPITVLGISTYTFLKNRADIIAFLDRVESGDLTLGPDPEALLREISRLLHNFLAAASTLVDHTRKTMTAYASVPEVQASYNQKKQALVESPLQIFVKDLRNYTLHKQLPVAGITTTFTRDPQSDSFTVCAEVYLDSAQLNDWPKWTSLAQQYLSAAPPQLSVRTVVNDYYDLVTTLYTWLETCLTTHHQPALGTLEARKREILSELRRRGVPT